MKNMHRDSVYHKYGKWQGNCSLWEKNLKRIYCRLPNVIILYILTLIHRGNIIISSIVEKDTKLFEHYLVNIKNDWFSFLLYIYIL